jgi:hypothetical protein
MHFYQFHIGDYKSHTHHLTLIEDLAYRRLLDHYYLHQAPIKQRDVARQIGMRDHEQEVLTVLDEFFISTEDGYINPRADKEIKAYVEHQATSAYGAFCRTNKDLVSICSKDVFVLRFLSGEHLDYIESLRVQYAQIMCTSSPHDLPIMQPITNNHEPITNNQEPVIDAAPKGAAKGKRLSPEWELPKAWGDWTISEFNWTENQVRAEAEKFKDFWIAKPGKDGVKLDWSATWRNWCRNAKVQPDKQNSSLLSGGI